MCAQKKRKKRSAHQGYQQRWYIATWYGNYLLFQLYYYYTFITTQNMCESMNLYIVLIYSVGHIGLYVDRGEVSCKCEI